MNFSKAHFIGIAGKGMSATALLLKQMGVRISGSDEGFYPPVSDYLKSADIAFAKGYRKENIPDDADVIIIGKNAKLQPETNEEVRAAFASGKLVRSFADIVHDMTLSSENVVVAGSYGKSTCTALLAWCLRTAKKDPSYFIGEVTNGFECYAQRGQGSVFVLEGDEYPSSNWDSTSKFLRYNARNVLLTSATHDHINVFPTHADYLVPFRALLDALPSDGVLVACGSEPHARALVQATGRPAVFYALDDRAHWHADNIARGARTDFDLMRGSEKVVRLSTRHLGNHNIENIVGVSAMLLEKGLLTPEELRRRRFVHGRQAPHGIAVGLIDGAGVRRIRLVLREGQERHRRGQAALPRPAPDGGVRAPHVHLAKPGGDRRLRRRVRWSRKILIYEPASQGAGSHAQLTQDEIVDRVRSAKYDAEAIVDPEEALQRLNGILETDDVVLLLTSGELGGLIKTIPKLAEQKYPGTAPQHSRHS